MQGNRSTPDMVNGEADDKWRNWQIGHPTANFSSLAATAVELDPKSCKHG